MFVTSKIRKMLCAFCTVILFVPIVHLSASAAEITQLGHPKKMLLGEPVALNRFCDEKGSPVSIQPKEGQYTLLTYWASWCPDCGEEFSYLPKLKEVLKEYPNVQWYLVNRTDGERETLQTAAAFIKKKQIGLPVVYDKDLRFSDSIGIVQIPTTILLDPQGRAVICYPNIIKSQGHLRAMLDYAVKGADSATYSYVSNSLLNKDGSVASAPADSPAQSMLAEYAALSLKPELLQLQKSRLSTYNGTTGNLGNDLQMLRALSAWKGYETESLKLKQQISQQYFPGNQWSKTVALSDLDLGALELLGNKQIAETALQIVQKGYISPDFPLYQSEYNTEKKQYSDSSIDMFDSLMTVYHLAQQGKVKKQTIDWLRKTVETTGIKARYDQNGKPLARYNYETPGLYALTGLIALECGEQSLLTDSLIRMENSRVFDSASKQNGSFSAKGDDPALEQILPLVLYTKMQQK